MSINHFSYHKITFTTLTLLALFTPYITCERLFVFEHFQHGARSPLKGVNPTTNKDLLNEEWNADGELTPSGLRMHYLLGTINQKKYSDFISFPPNLNELLVYSTDSNRTIMSVYAHLQGMFNNTEEKLSDEQVAKANVILENSTNREQLEIESANMNYSVIKNNRVLFPVSILDNNKKEFLLHDTHVCPGIEKYKKQMLNSKEGKSFIKNIAQNLNNTYGDDLFRYFKYSDKDYYFERDNYYTLLDTFISDHIDNRELNEFPFKGNETFYSYSEMVMNSSLYDLEMKTEDDVIIHMGMSPTFRKIIDWMVKRKELAENGTPNLIESSSPKMVIYSGDENTVGLMALFVKKVFGVNVGQLKFATNQYFELHKENDNYVVKYIFNDDEKLSVPFDEFTNKIEKVLWSQEKINDFCDINKETNPWEIIMWVMLVVVICLTAAFIYLKRKFK